MSSRGPAGHTTDRAAGGTETGHAALRTCAADSRAPRPRRRRQGRRRRRRRIALLVVAAALAPIAYSYVTTMVRPSSLPLSVRTIEWIRANHGAWAVNTIERYWYTWRAPKKGGPALKTLPVVGTPVVDAPRRPAQTRPAPRKRAEEASCRRLAAATAPAADQAGASRRGRLAPGRRAAAALPAVLLTTFRSGARLPADRRLRRLDRPHEDAARALPWPVRAAERVPARADGGAVRAARSAAGDVQQRLHLQGRARRLRGQRVDRDPAPGRAGDGGRVPRTAAST